MSLPLSRFAILKIELSTKLGQASTGFESIAEIEESVEPRLPASANERPPPAIGAMAVECANLSCGPAAPAYLAAGSAGFFAAASSSFTLASAAVARASASAAFFASASAAFLASAAAASAALILASA